MTRTARLALAALLAAGACIVAAGLFDDELDDVQGDEDDDDELDELDEEEDRK